MKIFPAIDLYRGKVVRLLHGDYDKMTVYSNDPVCVALSFAEAGAEYIHIVDLEGADSGRTENFAVIRDIIEKSGLRAEVGGGIRSRDAIKRYLNAGAERVILGTAAVENNELLCGAVSEFGGSIAVGVDIKDGNVAVRGWRRVSGEGCFGFCERLCMLGIGTIICTDISRDGAMRGANRELYRELSERFAINIIASGGVSTPDDVAALSALGIYGAIIGRALYTGGIELREALALAGGGDESK